MPAKEENDRIMVPDNSESEPASYEESFSTSEPHLHDISYTESEDESYDSDYESHGRSYSDDSETESGDSFENDYESPAENFPSQRLSITEGKEREAMDHDDEHQSSYVDEADSTEVEREVRQHSSSVPSRSRIKQSTGEEITIKSAISSNKRLPKTETVIRNERRRVQWANPELLNWSFHEGFDNGRRKRRPLKRWNSSDDLVSSSGKRRGGRRDRGSGREDYPLRDPPGHHIESPSIKSKIIRTELIFKSNDETPAAIESGLPVVMEDDGDKRDERPVDYDLDSSEAEHDEVQTHRIPSCAVYADSPVLPVEGTNKISEIRENNTGRLKTPNRNMSADEVISSKRKCAPPRRVKSSGDAVGSAKLADTVTAGNISERNLLSSQAGNACPTHTCNSSSGSSADSKTKRSLRSRKVTAIVRPRRTLASKGSENNFTSEQSFTKDSSHSISNQKENPAPIIANVTPVSPAMAVTKRTPGRLSSSLHYDGPRTGTVDVESSKPHSQSMHAFSVSTTYGLVQVGLSENKLENTISSEKDANESIRSTDISSDSPSFALQASQSSLSSFHSHSQESTSVPIHNNGQAMSSIMSSATLIVTVSQGRGLVSLDRNIFGKMKSAEPLVELYLGGKACGKTGVARRSSTPVWKESDIVCEIGGDMAKELVHRSEKLELRIYDRFIKRETFMGAIMFTLPKDEESSWYTVTARSEQAAEFYCAGATGSLEIKVQITAKFYPVLMPDHVFVLRQHSKIALDLSWRSGPCFETSFVATDLDNGLLLWDESVYFANRTNPNRSIVFPERLELLDQPTIDTVVIDLDNVPMNVGTLCLVLTARSNSFSDIESLEIRCKDAITGQGIGRFVPKLKASDTSVVLLRMSRTKSRKSWDLEVMATGYQGFREFGSMQPEIQVIAQGSASRISRPAERTALMRSGDRIRIQDYAASLPENLSIGLYWKVANGENVLPLALLMDKDTHLLDVIHRQNPRSEDLSVAYADDRFQVALLKAVADIHYICFSLGPYLGEQADHILSAAFNMLNVADGTELVRSTFPDFDAFPTRTVTLGCLFRSGDSWDFTLLGLSSCDITIDDCTRTLQNYMIEKPLGHPLSLRVES
jgi:stress response protein SCP2